MSERAKVRRLLLDNLALKLSALVLASVLWLHASTLQTYETVEEVSLDVRGLADSLVLLSPLPAKVKVSFRGKGDQLWWLMVRKPLLVVSLDAVPLGVTVRELRPVDVQLPSGVDVQVTHVVSPRTLEVEVDRLVTKTVPVVLQTSGLPTPGYVRLRETGETEPNRVAIRGPASLVEDLDAITTEPLDVTNAKGEVSKRLKLNAPQGPGISLNVQTVMARVRFERVVYRAVRWPVEVTSRLPPPWFVHPDSVMLHLWVPAPWEDSLAQLNPAALRCEVTPSRMADSALMEVKVTVPPWVHQCTVEPPKVALKRKHRHTP